MLWQILEVSKVWLHASKNGDALFLSWHLDTVSRFMLPAKPICPCGMQQRGEKLLELGDLLGRRTGMRNSDKKEGQEMGKGFIRHESCMSNAVWRSLWYIPVPHHSLNEVNKPNQLCSLYLTCQTCSSVQEDQDWGGYHQQHNTCVGQHPGTTLSVSFPGPSALASITSQQKVCSKILRKDSTALHLNDTTSLNVQELNLPLVSLQSKPNPGHPG